MALVAPFAPRFSEQCTTNAGHAQGGTSGEIPGTPRTPTSTDGAVGPAVAARRLRVCLPPGTVAVLSLSSPQVPPSIGRACDGTAPVALYGRGRAFFFALCFANCALAQTPELFFRNEVFPFFFLLLKKAGRFRGAGLRSTAAVDGQPTPVVGEPTAAPDQPVLLKPRRIGVGIGAGGGSDGRGTKDSLD